MKQKKYVIGLTGGIGVGKSTVLEYLEESYGAWILQSDLIAREMMEKGGAVYRFYVELFGNQILSEDGTIDRKKTASLMYADPEIVRKVNSTVHPLVKSEIKRRIRESDYPFFVIESALIFEGELDTLCEEIWAVTADEKIRISRLMESRGMSEEACRQIMAKQVPQKTYEKHADVRIENSGELSETFSQVDSAMNLFLKKHSDLD